MFSTARAMSTGMPSIIPSLGQVELGGWDFQYAWRNPPPQLLEREIAPFSDWLIYQAVSTPCLELTL